MFFSTDCKVLILVLTENRGFSEGWCPGEKTITKPSSSEYMYKTYL